MPLPVSDTKTVWPPENMAPIFSAMGKWAAWASNDVEALQAAYGAGTSDSTGFFTSDTGGMKPGALARFARWFVGQAPTGAERNTKLPVPIAAEIGQASADLLFSDPITVTAGNETTQERVNGLLDDSFHSTIAEAAEMTAFLGGSYLRVTWDDSVSPDAPFTTIIDADQVLPEFKWGRLVAMTTWSVIAREGKIVWRHLERHELDAFGVGLILHGLYMGEENTLGYSVSLLSRPETAALAAHVDLNTEGSINTLSPGLAVTYVPNQTPQRMWRHHPVGRNLGRSDLDGIERLMDQLAETMSDWMRARRAARARTFYAKDLVKSAGPGKGGVLDVDQESYVETAFSGGSGPSSTPKMSDRIQTVQPSFEWEQYKATADALIEQILQMAGYSLSTFGVQPDIGGEKTATEIEARERRSLMTRARKSREWKPALEAHLTKLLHVDQDFFGTQGINTDGLSVEFSDGVQESQFKLGQFVASVFNAESMSIEERVEVLHPDWDDDQKDTEVGRIKEQFSHPVESPIFPPFDDPAPPEPLVTP